MSIDDFARAVIAHALRSGDLHEDCASCAGKIADALRVVPRPAVGPTGADRVLRAVYVWCAMAAAAEHYA